MASPTTYLITGANRGIGLALTSTYLLRPHTTVIAAVRSHKTSSLSNLPKSPSSTLLTVEINASDPNSAFSAIESLRTAYGINSLNVVIANAGISSPAAFGPIASVKISDVKEHIDVNALGALALFQATLPLLQNPTAARGPGMGKFITVSSPIGSIGGMEQRPFPMSAYGASKAALNWLTRKMYFEHEELVVFALDPGFVQTELGNKGAAFFGMKEATTSVEESVAGMVKVIDGANRDKTGGRFPIFNGGEFPW